MKEEKIIYLKTLLGSDKLEVVIKFLREQQPDNENLIQINGRLNALNNAIIKGTISNEESQRFRNSIRVSILTFIEQLSENFEQNNNNTRSDPFPIIISLLWIAFCVYVVFLISKCPMSILEIPKKKKYDIPPIAQDDKDTSIKNVPISTNILQAFFEEKKMTAYDNSGKKAEYIIFIVRNFNWQIGQIDISERDGLPSDICEELKQIGVSERINRQDLKGIVCIGNTSYEEDVSVSKHLRTIKEEERADKRAKKLANCVSSVLTTITPIFISNVGKYIYKDDLTTYQRSVIIVGIIKDDEGAIDEEALYNGFILWHELENWEIDITQYSKIKEDKIQIKRYYN